ncbi:MAG: hypothetical protein KF752_01975 [Pirellulaceae bacterium]|nr:hypothetical protein [Pirellulaceae bacterium]
MQQLHHQSRIAQRRLIVQRFLSLAPQSFGTLIGIASVAVMLPKIMALPVPDGVWYGCWLGSAALLGLLVNSVLTWTSRPSLSDTAAEVDRRFGLRERLSSAVLLTPQDQQTSLGQALMADAESRAEVLDVASRFGWGWNRRLLVPLSLGLLSTGYFVIPNRQPAEASTESATLPVKQVKSATQPLLDQVRRKRQEAEDKQHDEAAEMLKRLEGELEKMQSNAKLDTKQALAQLNNIKKQLDERRQELGSAEALKKNLQNLEKFESGPMQQLASALKDGDFQKAQQSVDELLKKLKSGEMDATQLEKLQQQMEQLQKALSDAQQAHQQTMKNLEEQIRQAQQTGDLQRAGELQRKLEQLQAMDSSLSRMQQLSEMLSQCRNCASKGDQQGVQDSLESIQSLLDQMDASDSQLQDIDQLMDSLSQCKSGMCQGQGMMNSQRPGHGLGEGQGEGERPEEEEDVDFFQSQVRAQRRQGENVYSGKIGGENRKGVSRVAVQEEIARELASEPEPLDETPLPRSQREHTRDYFNALREGK